MKKLIPAYLRVLVIFFAVVAAMEYFIDSGDQPAFIKFPMVSLFLFVFLFLLIAIEITIKAVDTITYQLLTEEQKAKLAVNIESNEKSWFSGLMEKMTQSVPLEKESEF